MFLLPFLPFTSLKDYDEIDVFQPDPVIITINYISIQKYTLLKISLSFTRRPFARLLLFAYNKQ